MDEEGGGGTGFFSGDFTSYNKSSTFKPYNNIHHHSYSGNKPTSSRPPLTAIDRFLSGQSHHLTNNSHHQFQADHHDQNKIISANGLSDFSNSSIDHHHDGAITNSGVHFSWPSTLAADHHHNDHNLDHHQDHEASFFEGLFVDDHGDDHDNHMARELALMNRTAQERMNMNTCSKGVVEVVEMINSCKEMGKRAHKKASSSAALIKGQWTDEEDR